jgi:thiamine pyrophosphate-dependent acetolactate synthase large subunit-like protein
MAKERNRPVANKWIGQHITHPDIDLAAMAEAQGAQGFGPVRDLADLPEAVRLAIAAVDAGGVAVVDVRVEPGYDSGTSGAISRAPGAR